MTPTTTYVLSHVYRTRGGEYEEKLLGSYSSRAKAQQAVKRYKKLPGFRQHPESFVIFESVLDQDSAWIEGFFTLNPHTALVFKIVPRAEWRPKAATIMAPRMTRGTAFCIFPPPRSFPKPCGAIMPAKMI